MPAQIVSSTLDAPWLPPGGRADVVVDRDGLAPTPTCLVRLLIRRGATVFCLPRDGTGKLDLPTQAVPALDDGAGTAAQLACEVIGTTARPKLVGYVRNVVERAAPDYPWPVPHAHFSVWEVDGDPAIEGEWLAAQGSSSPLRTRHWWPLL